MKKSLAIFTIFAAIAAAGERKQLPGQAGNDDIELEASVILDHDEIAAAIGSDIGEGYIVLRMKASPKNEALRIGPDDFTLVSRKDGQKSAALTPTEIAGKGALVVNRGSTDDRKSGWSAGGFGGGLGSSPGTVQRDVIKDTKLDENAKESPALAALKAKILPDKETKTPIEGLLYFSITGKVKLKDIGLIYKGPAGKLVMDFAPIKK